MDQVRSTISKLNNENYFNWRFRIEMLMQREETWEVIEQPIPEPVTTAWTKKDSMARATIGLMVDDSQLVIIRNCATAKQMWERLKEAHQHANMSSKLFLLRKLYSSKYKEGSSMRNHLNEIINLVDRLTAIGKLIKPSHIVAIMLCSLTQKFDALITTIEAKEEKDITVEYIKNRLIDEASRRDEELSEQEKNESAFSSMNLRPSYGSQFRTCYNCRQTGHLSRDCRYGNRLGQAENRERTRNTGQTTKNEERNYLMRSEEDTQRNMQNEEDDQIEIAFSGIEQPLSDQDTWIIDSGASSHMCKNKQTFISLELYEKPRKVLMANGENISAYGIGQVKLNIVSEGKTRVINLSDTMWVPDITQNLISVRKVCSKGLTVQFKDKVCDIKNDNKTLVTTRQEGSIYPINVEYATIANAACICVWHRRLGHRAHQTIKEMERCNNYPDLKITKCKDKCPKICEPCQYGGMAQKKFEIGGENVSEKAFQILNADLCGPVHPTSLGGNKYFITITDKFSKYTFTVPLKNKFMVNDEMKKFIMMGHTKHGYYPQVVRTDGGGEFFNNEIEKFYNNKGIIHQMSVPHTPQQNGDSERKNRTLIEMTRKLLSDAGVNKTLWGEAICTATYLYNRTLNTVTHKTPLEMWEGRIPKLNNLHVFGDVAYCYVPREKRGKLDNSSVKGIFVGYSQTHKGYRVWLENSNKIMTTRSVNFCSSTNKSDACPEGTMDKINGTEESSITVDMFNSEEEIQANKEVRKSSRENAGKPPQRLSY